MIGSSYTCNVCSLSVITAVGTHLLGRGDVVLHLQGALIQDGEAGMALLPQHYTPRRPYPHLLSPHPTSDNYLDHSKRRMTELHIVGSELGGERNRGRRREGTRNECSQLGV